MKKVSNCVSNMVNGINSPGFFEAWRMTIIKILSHTIQQLVQTGPYFFEIAAGEVSGVDSNRFRRMKIIFV